MEYSLLSSLLIFYLLVSSNMTNDLMGKQMKSYLKSNRLAQHIVAITMMLVLLTLIGKFNNIFDLLLFTLLGYTWFIFTTKLDIQWNIMVLIVLLIGFLYENNMIMKENKAINDEALTEKEINKIKNKHEKIKKYFVFTAFGITAVGTLLYGNKKTVQYGGGNFDIVRYLLY